MNTSSIKIGAFILFIILGLNFHGKFPTDTLVAKLFLGAIWTSGIYYFYLNAATESLWGKNDSKAVKIFDSIWITVQFLCFELIWHLVGENLIYYALDMCILNLTYLIWDIVHHSEVTKKAMGKVIYVFDVFGLCISIFVFLYSLDLPSSDILSHANQKSVDENLHHAMWVVSFLALLIYHSVIGFIIAFIQFKYPFHSVKTENH